MDANGSGYYGSGVELPNRAAGQHERKYIAALDRDGSSTDAPAHLPISKIVEEPNLFQPRFDSIGYAPGRSETHVAMLAKTAKRGEPLDPIWVVSFGDKWYMVDGHHRLAAYRKAEWADEVPVKALATDLRGEQRINWAVEQSYSDNKKNRLALSELEKSDGAWRAVARGDDLSKTAIASIYNVGVRTVGTMRETKRKLEALGCPAIRMMQHGWRGAKGELRDREEDNGGTSSTWNEQQQRKLAKRLKPVFDMRMSAAQLAEALEAYSPNIVREMAAALAMEEEGEE